MRGGVVHPVRSPSAIMLYTLSRNALSKQNAWSELILVLVDIALNIALINFILQVYSSGLNREDDDCRKDLKNNSGYFI